MCSVCVCMHVCMYVCAHLPFDHVNEMLCKSPAHRAYKNNNINNNINNNNNNNNSKQINKQQ